MASLSKFHCSVDNENKRSRFGAVYLKLAQLFHHHREYIAPLLNCFEYYFALNIAPFIS